MNSVEEHKSDSTFMPASSSLITVNACIRSFHQPIEQHDRPFMDYINFELK